MCIRDRDIAELVRYAHVYNVRIYVTVNTILKDEELKDTEDVYKRQVCFYGSGFDTDSGTVQLSVR